MTIASQAARRAQVAIDELRTKLRNRRDEQIGPIGEPRIAARLFGASDRPVPTFNEEGQRNE